MASLVHLLVTLTAIFQLSASTASTGCSGAQGFYAGGSFTINLESGGYDRSALITFPNNYGQNSAGSPLIVAYHGSDRDPAYMREMSQFSNEIYNPNAVVVYPLGVGEHWQGSPLANPGVNDIQFTEDLLNYVSSQYCLNRAAFFASGHSNGGGFVNTIACWPGVSGMFRAFAPMSFAVYAGSQGPNGVCNPDHVVTPILEMHGYADTIVPYNGGAAQGSTVAPVLTTMTNWVYRNGCSQGYFPPTDLFPGKVTVYHNYVCDVHQYTFHAMGHYWPSNATSTPEGDFKTPVEGTAVIIKWFDSLI